MWTVQFEKSRLEKFLDKTEVLAKVLLYCVLPLGWVFLLIVLQ